MGRTGGVVDALRRLELDVARYQDRIARFAADFLRGHPFRSRSNRSSCGVNGAGAPIAAAGVGLPGSGFYRRSNVCGLLFWGELHVSSGLAAVLQATIPIFGMVFAHLMLPDEPLRLQKL